MKNFLMTRKTHEAIIKEKEERQRREIFRLIQEYEEKEKELQKDLKEIVGNLTKIAVVSDPTNYKKWRVVTEFDAEMMCRSLERGNDNVFIDYMGNYVGEMVSRELRSCNIQRSETFRMGRG